MKYHLKFGNKYSGWAKCIAEVNMVSNKTDAAVYDSACLDTRSVKIILAGCLSGGALIIDPSEIIVEAI